MCVCIYIYINMYIYICVCLSVCLYVSVYVRIYMYVDFNTHVQDVMELLGDFSLCFPGLPFLNLFGGCYIGLRIYSNNGGRK